MAGPVTAIVGRWEGFWFTPVPVRRLAVFRIAVCGFALLDMLIGYAWIARYGNVDREFYQPIQFLRLPHRVLPSGNGMLVMRVVLVIALALATAGLCTRLALA